MVDDRGDRAAILRGGSEAIESNRALHAALQRGFVAGGVPADAIQLVPTTDRAAVGAMLAAEGLIDMVVPRGGKSLVARVQAEARVPVLAHLDGINHSYVDGAADPDMARALVVNAKLRRTGICGATETLLVDRAGAERLLPPVAADLIQAAPAQDLRRRVQAVAIGCWRAGPVEIQTMAAAPSRMAALGLQTDIRAVARAGGRVVAAVVLSLVALVVLALALIRLLGL